jgi:eukaryotic-like serine/threonine-protein kinase
MSLVSGTKLGPYEIVEPLGVGGMGEVYRGRDTRLERAVAIKILPVHLSNDPIRKQRFEREAKTVSSLNHPHICVLHDVGHQDGMDYLVMECVEGETLAKRLEKGPLPVDQVLKLGAQIADALDKAHRAGIVHRDLKPANIMLTATGAKLLDFGLAKPAAPLASAATLTALSPKSPVTEQGMIVGTFQYMSPEQVEGKEVDGRSDIFSLGAVLYEMVTGKRAFGGKSQLSVATAILEREPEPVSTVKPSAPAALDHAIKKCLSKSSDERWQSASDLASELKWITESGAQTDGTALRRGPGKERERVAWLIAAIAVAAVIVGAVRWPSLKPPEQAMYFPTPMSFPARDIAMAPNGHTVAVVGYRESVRKNVLFIYELGSPGARNLADTDGATYPFWSADGRSLAFFADGKLKKVDLTGGQVQTICDAPNGRGGTWNKDGAIVFAPDTNVGLHRVSASGGTPTQISKLDRNRGEDGHRWPMFLPDGTHYLYLAANFTGRKGVNAIFAGSLDSDEKRFIVEASANAIFTAPGYLLFYRDKALLAQPFDLKRFALTGQPTTVLTDIQYLPQVRRALFAVSDNGALVSQTGSSVALSQPVWFDRKGKEVGVVGTPDVYGNVFLASNGRFVATDKTDMGSQNVVDIWTYELQRESTKRLTFNPSLNAVPVWSPDATRLVFGSNRQLDFDLYLKNADGAQEEKSIVGDDVQKYPTDWSRNGKYVLYTRGPELWFVALPELKSNLFLKGPSVLRNGQFSPDGKWVAYASNETDKWEIYVTSFPEARGRWQISTGGGEQPRWRGDGKELFYLSSEAKMMAVPVTTGANFDSGSPVTLFQATPRPPVLVYDLFVYDVTRDGQRFLINTPVKQADTQPMSILLNWTTKLNK